MRGRSVAVVAGIMSMVVAVLPGGTAIPDIPDHPNKFFWQAPQNLTGDILVEVGVDHGEANACVVYHGASGRTGGITTALMSEKKGWAVSHGGGDLVTVHAGPVDTREQTDQAEGLWRSQFWTWSNSYSGTDVWTFAAFDVLETSFGGEPFPPFGIELSCRDPFTITSLAGSTTVHGFTKESLGGGAGAYSGVQVEASANVRDEVSARIDHEQGVAVVRGFQTIGAAAAHMTLGSPEGTSAIVLTPAADRFDFRGPGGAYDLHIDRVGAATSDSFWGMLYGLDRVDDLDEVLEG